MKGRPLNVIIVGFGPHAEEHLKEMQGTEPINIVSVVEPNSHYHELFRRRFGQENFVDEQRVVYAYKLETALKLVKADAVLIASPPETHADLIKVAVKNNLHVFCEFPFADNAQQLFDVETCLRIAKHRGLVVSVCHRYIPNLSSVKDELPGLTNVHGELLAIELYFNSCRKEHFVGANLPPLLALLLWMCGEVDGLSMHTAKRATYIEEPVVSNPPSDILADKKSRISATKTEAPDEGLEVISGTFVIKNSQKHTKFLFQRNLRHCPEELILKFQDGHQQSFQVGETEEACHSSFGGFVRQCLGEAVFEWLSMEDLLRVHEISLAVERNRIYIEEEKTRF